MLFTARVFAGLQESGCYLEGGAGRAVCRGQCTRVGYAGRRSGRLPQGTCASNSSSPGSSRFRFQEGGCVTIRCASQYWPVSAVANTLDSASLCSVVCSLPWITTQSAEAANFGRRCQRTGSSLKYTSQCDVSGQYVEIAAWPAACGTAGARACQRPGVVDAGPQRPPRASGHGEGHHALHNVRSGTQSFTSLTPCRYAVRC